MSIDKLLTDTSADLRNRIAKEPIPPPPRLESPPVRQTRRRPSWFVGIVSFTVILGVGVIALLLQAPNPPGPIQAPNPVPPTSASQTPDTSLEAISEPTLFDAGPLTGRDGHSVVWTGSELIVWGGVSSDATGAPVADGAAYDPSSNSWRMLAAAPIAPRQGHQAAWTGEEMLVVGGLGHHDGAAYNPASDTWRLLPSTPVPTTSPAPIVTQYTSSVWDGRELVMWNVPADVVAAYSPATDSWRPLVSTNLEADAGVLRWNGAELYAFAIEAFDPRVSHLRAARFDSEQWGRLTDLEIPSPMPMLSAWTGEEIHCVERHRRELPIPRGRGRVGVIARHSDQWV